MSKYRKKVTVKWSKKENDWISNYPSRNGRITGNAFFNMIRKFEEFMSTNWEGKPTGFTNIRDYLSSGVFEQDKFTLSVKEKLKDGE